MKSLVRTCGLYTAILPRARGAIHWGVSLYIFVWRTVCPLISMPVEEVHVRIPEKSWHAKSNRGRPLGARGRRRPGWSRAQGSTSGH